MDEKTRRGRVGSTGSRERQREGRRELREEERKNAEASIAGKARQDRAGHGERRAPRAPERATGSGSDKPGRRNGENEAGRRAGGRESRAEPRVGCGGDVAPVVFYLLKTSSELSAQVEFHSWNLNKGGQGFSPGRFVPSSFVSFSLSRSLSAIETKYRVRNSANIGIISNYISSLKLILPSERF